jgi:hypothetical protein
MQVIPSFAPVEIKGWTPAHLFGDMKRLPFRSSVRSQVQIPARKDLNVQRYVIACEFFRAKPSAAVGDCIRKIASEWQHPLSNIWIVETSLTARDIRSALLPHLSFQDRVFISESGETTAEFNTLPDRGGKVTQIEDARNKSRMLASIFSRNGQGSRHLKAATAYFKAATAKSLKSA